VFIGYEETRLVWILLTMQVTATLCCGAFVGGFQSSGRYALGVSLGTSARLVESGALVAGALLFSGFAPVVALTLVVRIAALAGMGTVLSNVAPWLSFSFRHASLLEVRRLAKPALAVMTIPAAFAVSLQGFVLVAASALSLEAVAVFSTARTLTRVVIQAAGIVNHAIMPEVTRAFGEHDLTRLRRLMRLNLISTLGLNVVAFLAVASFGSKILALWTHGRIAPSMELLLGLATVASLHSLWLSRANLVLAINRHAGYSYWFLFVSSMSVIGATLAVSALGINGLVVSLLFGEVAMILIVERVYRGTLESRVLDHV
jgi:O-antigen/teichoic acid export membrane protein